MPTELPAEVLDQLAPALALIGSEVQENVRVVERKKVDHAGRVAVRRNGGEGGDYDRGFKAIMRDLFPQSSTPQPTPTPPSTSNDEDGKDDYERNCLCELCDDPRCDGDCEACEDYSCSQCHDTDLCCGHCDSCDTCHPAVDASHHLYVNGDGVQFCTAHTHFCND